MTPDTRTTTHAAPTPPPPVDLSEPIPGDLRPEIGSRIVDHTTMFMYRQHPRPLNRELMLANGYNDIMIDELSQGFCLSRGVVTPSGLISVMELPDGRRYQTDTTYLPETQMLRFDILKQLSNGPR